MSYVEFNFIKFLFLTILVIQKFPKFLFVKIVHELHEPSIHS
jgi:hypothetical protein